MRRYSLFPLAIAALAIAVSPSFADDKPGGLAQPIALQALIANKAVQQELGLEEGQVEVVTKLAAEVRQLLQGANKLEQKERQQKYAQARQKVTAALKEKLNKEQLARFNQIDAQQRGALALNQNDVAKELGVKGMQRKKLREINKELTEQIQTLRKDNKGQALFEKMGVARNEARAKMMKVLNEEQQQAFKKMLGKPFDLTKLERRRNR